MHQQPAVKNIMHAALAVQVSFFLANVLQILQLWPQVAGNQDAQLGKRGGSLCWVSERRLWAARLQQKGPDLLLK